MKTSKKGIDLIKKFEGYRASPYVCQGGVLTIGIGHTKNVQLGDTCTAAQAEQYLLEDLEIAEAELNKIPNLTQQKFDALASFIFNIGIRNFQTSTLRKKVLADMNDPTIRYEFNRWCIAGGKVSKGLERRRLEEANLYFS